MAFRATISFAVEANERAGAINSEAMSVLVKTFVFMVLTVFIWILVKTMLNDAGL